MQVDMFERLSEISQYVDWTDDARQLINGNITTSQCLNKLLDNKQYQDAIGLLAHALPQATSIRWCYDCVNFAEKNSNDSIVQDALNAVSEWLKKPTEETRIATQRFGEQLAYKTPSSWLAMAVFWSGGNIADSSGPVVEPQPYLWAKAVVGAILLAGVFNAPEKADANYKSFIDKIGITNNAATSC